MLKPQNPITEISIPAPHIQQMRQHVIQCVPEEACGLVAGSNGCSLEIYPMENVLKSPVRFLMNPEQQLRIFQLLEDRGWDLLAIYHSHPNGPPTPSDTDVAETYYSDAVSLIWSITGDDWGCRAFVFQDGSFHEIPLQVGRE